MITYRLDQLPEFEKWVRKGLLKAAQRGVISAAMRTVQAIQTEIIPNESPPPVDQGAFRAGWKAEPTKDGARIYNDIPYGVIIDGGARAENIKVGRKMIEALTKWIRRKGIAGRRPKARAAVGQWERDTEQMAWAIAMAMKKKGIFNRDGKKGLRISQKGLERFKKYLPAEVVRELRRGLDAP